MGRESEKMNANHGNSNSPATAAITSTSHRSPSAPLTFGSTEFDAKRWINQQLRAARENANKRSNDAGDSGNNGSIHSPSPSSSLSSLLLKLQMHQADLNAAMEAHSQELIQAMPRALRDVSSIERESGRVRTALADLSREMEQKQAAKAKGHDHTHTHTQSHGHVDGSASTGDMTSASAVSSASSTIEYLQAIDVVKNRIMRCANTLAEMETWRQRERKMEEWMQRLQVVGGAKDATGDDEKSVAGPSSSAPVLLSPLTASTYTDLHHLATVLSTMRSLLHRFKALGLSVEFDQRSASVRRYERRVHDIADAVMHATMQRMLEVDGADVELTQAVTSEDLSDGEGSSALPSNADSLSMPSPPSSIIRSLRVLSAAYSSLDRLSEFRREYEKGRVRALLMQRVIAKYQQRTTAPSSTSAASASPSPSASGAASKYSPSSLPQWLPALCTDIIQFAEDELAFAFQVLNGNEDQNWTRTEADLPEVTESDSTRSHHATTHNDGSTSLSSDFFVPHLILSSIHDEMIPVLTSWFSQYMSGHKGADGCESLVNVCSLLVNQLATPLARHLLVEHDDAYAGAPDTDIPSALAQQSIHVHMRSMQRLLVELVYEPCVRYLDEYAMFEKKKLLSSLDGMSFGGGSYEQTADNIASSHKIIVQATAAARHRCVRLSCGVLIEQLVDGVGEYYTEYTQRLFSLLRRLRRIAGLDGMSRSASASLAPPSSHSKGSTSPLSPSPSPTSSPSSSPTTDSSSTDAMLQSGASSWSNFQGCFHLLSVCRALQRDIFSIDCDQTMLDEVCSDTIPALLNICDEEREAETNHSLPPSTSRRSSSTDISQLLAALYLIRHPDRQTSLKEFVKKHGLPRHPHHAALLTPTTLSPRTHGSTGVLHAHPTTPQLATASPLARTTPNAAATPTTSATSTGHLSPSHLFSASAQLFDSFISALHNLIFDCMFKPVSIRLSAFPTWTNIWNAKSSTGLLSSMPLPSFSLQPSEYVIAIGEHILTVVQQLEPYVHKQDDDEEGERATDDTRNGDAIMPTHTSSHPPPSTGVSRSYIEHDALYWLNLLSKGTFKSLLSSIHQLSTLSDRGAKQLHTDIEYMINVLSALGVAVPETIQRLNQWLQATEMQMMEAAKGTNTNKHADADATFDLHFSELSSEQRKLLRHLIICRGWKTMGSSDFIMTRLEH